MSKKQSPLESAKVGKDNTKKTGWPKGSAAKKAAKDAEASKKPDEGLAPLGEDATTHPPESAKQEAPAAPAAAPIRRFKVLKKITVSMHGSITVLNYGSIISSQHYGGMPGIEKLVKDGVELEPTEE